MTRLVRLVRAVAVGVALGLGLLEWSPPVAIALFVVAGCIAAASITIAAAVRGGGAPRRLWQRSLVTACYVVGCWALLTFSPPVALLAAILVGLTAVPAGRLVRRPARSADPEPRVERPPVVTSPGPLALECLDDHALCVVWRESFWELRNQTTPEGLLRVVRLRQHCLDELERRDAAALQSWLRHGARASGGPEKYWHRPSAGTADAA